MNADDFLKGLGAGADFLFQDLDLVNRRGLLVKFDEAGYRRASFLDQRAFTQGTLGAWQPLDRILREAEALAAPPAPHAIFHVSHCGSTLISRLLAELPGNLPVREPLVLLTSAQERRELDRPTARLDQVGWARLFDGGLRLLSRTYRPGERALIKATSACGNLVSPLLRRDAVSKALLLHTDLETWLAVMLRNEDVRGNGRFYAPAWLSDLHVLTGRKDIRLSAMDDAQQFAVNWLTTMLHYERALQENPERVRRCDFEKFLADPVGGLTAAGQFLGLDTVRAGEIVSGPLMKSYAKRPQEAFDPATRHRELEEARGRLAPEIATGMKFAEKLCNEISMLAPVGAYFRRS